MNNYFTKTIIGFGLLACVIVTMILLSEHTSEGFPTTKLMLSALITERVIYLLSVFIIAYLNPESKGEPQTSVMVAVAILFFLIVFTTMNWFLIIPSFIMAIFIACRIFVISVYVSVLLK